MSTEHDPPTVDAPYWRIDAGGPLGVAALFGKLAAASGPSLRLLRSAAPRAGIAIVVAQLVSGVATALALLSIAALLTQLLDGGIAPPALRAALPLMLQLLAVLVLQLLADVAARVAKAHVVPKVHQVAEGELYRSSLAVGLESFDDPGFYDQLMRARDRGVMHLEGAIDSLVDVGAASFAVAGAAVALMILHPLLFAILLLALMPEAWTALASARVQYAGMPTTIALSRQVQMMAELATRRECAPEIRANQTQDYVLDEYRVQATRLQDHLVALGLREVKLAAIGRVLSGIGLLATFAALVAMLQGGWLGLAAAGTAVVAIRSASAEIARLIQALNGLVERALYIGDYHDFIAQAQRRSGDAVAGESRTLPIDGRIEIRDVGFAYPNSSGAPALRNITLTIEPRQTIALVGENGSGKTTLAKLISGLYRPTSGRILVDGIDLASFDRRALAARVAMVLQEPIRWPRSARDNIRLGRYEQIDPDDARLLDAARQSHAQEVVERLPQRWDTLLSKEFRGGRDLSSGQWQRLAVARGLFRDAPLVIWDEPTAPLDARAERAVYDSLRTLSAERTVILITHRLASIRDADCIHFLEQGAIVESGTHAELMALAGRYAELYRLQARMHALEDSE